MLCMLTCRHLRHDAGLVWQGCDAVRKMAVDNKGAVFKQLAGVYQVVKDTMREVSMTALHTTLRYVLASCVGPTLQGSSTSGQPCCTMYCCSSVLTYKLLQWMWSADMSHQQSCLCVSVVHNSFMLAFLAGLLLIPCVISASLSRQPCQGNWCI